MNNGSTTSTEVNPDGWLVATLNKIALGEPVGRDEMERGRNYFGFDEPTPPTPEPTVSLVEWIELQVGHYKSLGTDAGLMVADHLSDLLAEVSILGAKTPDQVWDRRAAMAGYHD